MFRDLRPSSTFFIFDKGENPGLKIGTVTAVSQPVLKPQTQFNPMLQPVYTVDVTVSVGDSTLTFNQLPTQLSLIEYADQKVVVSTNRDQLKNEIENTLAHSKQILTSISRHEKMVQECEVILQELNPTHKKDKEQEEEIKRLREQVASMEQKLSGLDEIKDIKALLLEQGKQNNKPNKNN